jgi:hypothetical protein
MDNLATQLATLIWHNYGILGLGWTLALVMGCLVVILFYRIIKIYNAYLEFVQKANADLLPVISKNTEALQMAARELSDVTRDTNATREMVVKLSGQLEPVVMRLLWSGGDLSKPQNQ